jgi:hypothetical protein
MTYEHNVSYNRLFSIVQQVGEGSIGSQIQSVGRGHGAGLAHEGRWIGWEPPLPDPLLHKCVEKRGKANVRMNYDALWGLGNCQI